MSSRLRILSRPDDDGDGGVIEGGQRVDIVRWCSGRRERELLASHRGASGGLVLSAPAPRVGERQISN